MTKNAYTGRAPLQLDGREFGLVFDWEALARVKSELGGDALKIIAEGPDPERLALIVAIGLARLHPEMSAPAVMALSPPFVPTMNAVSAALSVAYWGPKGPPAEVPEPNPPVGLARIRTPLSGLWRWLTGQGSRRRSFGG